MATYKVIQDIEAEDKFLGPLTLKQFIYAAIAAVSSYLTFYLFSRGAGIIALIFLPFIIVPGFFAWPWSRDQPTEVWALAKIRFMLKPRRRIWDQSGIKELVTITAPKKIEKILSKNLSETEVRSRLEALANTIDSRGWAIKNVNFNLNGQGYNTYADSDRLINLDSLTPQAPLIEIQPAEDILDEQTSPTAQYFDKMISQSSETHKRQAVDRMRQASGGTDNSNPPPDYRFMRGEPTVPPNVPSGYSTFFQSQVVTPGTQAPHKKSAPSAAEEALLKKLQADHDKPNPTYGHMRVLKPLSEQKAAKTPPAPQPAPQPAHPAKPDPKILQLATNDDLNVATIARQAEKELKNNDGEVVIKLH